MSTTWFSTMDGLVSPTVDNFTSITPEFEGNKSSACRIKFHKAESSFLLLLGIVFNCIAVTVLIRVRRRTRARTSTLTILLAGNDLFGCTVLMTSTILNTATCDRFSRSSFCNILGLIGFSSYTWSLNIVVLLSLERYILIKQPFFHLKGWSRVVLLIVCISGIFIDLTLGSLPLTGIGLPYQYYKDNKFCGINFKTKFGGLSQRAIVGSVAVNGILRALTVAYCNIAVSCFMKKRAEENIGSWNDTQKKAMKNARTFSRLTQVIAVSNIALTVPFSIKVLVDTATGSKATLVNIEDVITSVLLFVTPLLNPILYVATNAMYRKCLWEMVKCKASPRIPQGSSKRRATVSFSLQSMNSSRDYGRKYSAAESSQNTEDTRF